MERENERFFVGRTENYLIEQLKEKGFLSHEFVYASFSHPANAYQFIQKAVHFDIVELKEPGKIHLKKEQP